MLFELVRPIGDDWGGEVVRVGGVWDSITGATRALAVLNSEDVEPLVFIRPLGSGWLNPNEHEDEFWRLVSAG